MTITGFYTQIRDALSEYLPAFIGPAESLPLTGGKVAQCAVIWGTPGVSVMRSDSRAVIQRDESFTVVCVGATSLDALAAADKVRRALTGQVLPVQGKGMSIREDGFTAPPPAVEPGTNPVRVSLTIQFRANTKE